MKGPRTFPHWVPAYLVLIALSCKQPNQFMSDPGGLDANQSETGSGGQEAPGSVGTGGYTGANGGTSYAWDAAVLDIVSSDSSDGPVASTDGSPTTEGAIRIVQFTLGAGAYPQFITSAMDGNLWFTDRGRNKIGRITTEGFASEFAIPTPNSDPAGITACPDGTLWFTEQRTNKIGRMTLAGSVTEYPLAGYTSPLFIVCAGDDLWFTDVTGRAVRMNRASGDLFPIQAVTPPSAFGGISSAGGALWFTSTDGGVGVIKTDGSISEHRFKFGEGSPRRISGAWFSIYPHAIGSITPEGVVKTFAIDDTGGSPGAIVGSTSGLWISLGDRLARRTLDGSITYHPVPGTKDIHDLAEGIDRRIWFTVPLTGKIGRVAL